MKSPAFGYHDPGTVSEAVGLLATLPNARVLAGGQSLMPMLNMRVVLPDHLIDLNGVAEMSGVSIRDGLLVIGAMTRQRDIEFSDSVMAHCPILPEALLQVGHRQTRNRGTVGGSLCHLDPSAELPCLAAVMDAVIETASPRGRRQIAFADFASSYMTTSLEPDEIATSAQFPLWPQGHGYAFLEFARRHGDFALASAAVLMTTDAQGRITRIAVALSGVGPVPVRMQEAEQALLGQVGGAELFAQAAKTCASLEPQDDIHAPAAYRKRLAGVMMRRALEKAFGRAARQ
jgi:carbon-monoxide dehydrogenase medium subunit